MFWPGLRERQVKHRSTVGFGFGSTYITISIPSESLRMFGEVWQQPLPRELEHPVINPIQSLEDPACGIVLNAKYFSLVDSIHVSKNLRVSAKAESSQQLHRRLCQKPLQHGLNVWLEKIFTRNTTMLPYGSQSSQKFVPIASNSKMLERWQAWIWII